MAEEILNTAITEESPIVESPIIESDTTEETIPDGIENLKLLHTALSGDKEYVDLVPKDFNKFIKQYSDGENATLLFQALRGDSEYSDMIPSDAVEAASMFGVTINPKSWGKPSAVPSPSVNGGSATRERGVEEPSTPQPTSVESKPPSALQRNEINGIRVPKYLYGMKAEDFQDPKVIRYTLTKLGVDMSEFTSDDVAKVLESDYTNAGDMVEDIAQTVIDRRANPEPIEPQEEEGGLKQSFVTVQTKKPLVLAPEKFDDIYGLKKSVNQIYEDSKDTQPNSSTLLASYERDQQTAIDINKKIIENETKINDLKTGYSARTLGVTPKAEIDKLQAETEQLKKAQYKQTNIANQSLAKAQPILDKYVDGLTDGLKFNQFVRDDGTLKTGEINDAANKIAQQAGLSDEGVVVKYVEGLIGSRAKVNLAKPAALGIFEADRQKILDQYKIEKEQVEEAYKAPVDIEKQAKLNIQAVEDELNVFQTRENDIAEEKYKSTIKQSNEAYDAGQREYARQIEEQKELVRQNQLPANVANANINAIVAKAEQETAAINQNNLELFNQLQSQFNEIGTKYNNQYKRRQQEIIDASEKLIKKDFEKYVKQVGFDKKTAEVNEKLKTAYSKAWDLALKNIDDQKIAKTEKLRDDAGFFDLIKGISGGTFGKSSTLQLAYLTFNNSLGSSVEALGDGMGLEWMRLGGKKIKDATDLLSPAKVKSWSDLLDFGNVVQLSSQLGGSMAPSVIATAGATFLTGGAGFSAGLGIGAQMVAGAYAGWMVESTDMARRMYLDTVSSTGNAVLGAERADKMWDFQKKMMWTYSFSAVPFIGSFWKGVRIFTKSPRLAAASKIVMGGALEYGEETLLQEYPQGIGEEAIMSNRDAITAVGEQISRVKQYLTGDGVYKSEQEKKDVEGAWQRFNENAITTFPTLGFGAAGAARGAIKEYNQKIDIKKEGVAYYQKFVASEAAPHIAEQEIRRLSMTKGPAFAGTMVSNLFAEGSLNLEQRDKLLASVEKTKTYISNAKQQKLKAEDAAIYMTLADIHESAQAEADAAEDPILKDASQKKADIIKKELTDFLVTKETNLLGITLANGEAYIVTIDDLNTMIEDSPDLIGDMADGNFKVQSLGNNTTKLQQDAIESLGQRIEEHKANAAAQQAEQESKVKTLEDDIEVGDTVDLTPSAQPTTEEAPQAEATTEENVGDVKFTIYGKRHIKNLRDGLVRSIEFWKEEIKNNKPKTIFGKLEDKIDRAIQPKRSSLVYEKYLEEAENDLIAFDANPLEYYKKKIEEDPSDERNKENKEFLESERITPDNIWEYSSDPIENIRNEAEDFIRRYDKGDYFYESAIITLDKIKNDPIGLLKERLEYYSQRNPDEIWSKEELDSTINDLNTKIKLLEQEAATGQAAPQAQAAPAQETAIPENLEDTPGYAEAMGIQPPTQAAPQFEAPTIEAPTQEQEAQAPVAEEAKALTSREIDIKRQQLSDNTFNAKLKIANADDTELAIKEYNNAKKAESDFEAELEKVNSKVNSKKRVDNLIEDEKDSYDNDSTYKFKELFEQDPRLAALQSQKEMLDYVKSDDYIKYYTDRGETDAKKRQQDSIKSYEGDIADLEADLKENPPKEQAPESFPAQEGAESVEEKKASIFDDLDASRVGGSKSKQIAANRAFAKKYGKDTAVARVISANFEAIANELKSKGVFIDIDCK